MPGSGCAGVVLVGGRSSRMGTSKAALEWHGSTLLRRTVGILARATRGPVVVVRAENQDLPGLPDDVRVVNDPRDGMGPVQGLAAGLGALEDQADVAFVSATDMPFLHPAFVRRVLRAAREGADVGLPVVRGYQQPLAAAYRTALAPVAEELVRAERLRPAFLFQRCRVTRLDEAALLDDPRLAAFDPALDSLVNVNDPDDYQRARARPAPEIAIQWSGGQWPKRQWSSGHQRLCAATVAEAAAAAGVDLGHAVAELNGDRLTTDGQTPLAAGDTVSFR
jgi:molybdenum cofactor guanylyltransferase